MKTNRYFNIGLLVAVGLLIAAAPVQAQKAVSSAGFNPQEILRNALQWIDNLGALAAVAFIVNCGWRKLTYKPHYSVVYSNYWFYSYR